jgi:hypothetical protein
MIPRYTAPPTTWPTRGRPATSSPAPTWPSPCGLVEAPVSAKWGEPDAGVGPCGVRDDALLVELARLLLWIDDLARAGDRWVLAGWVVRLVETLADASPGAPPMLREMAGTGASADECLLRHRTEDAKAQFTEVMAATGMRSLPPLAGRFGEGRPAGR